jgi:hypothetical protein
MTDWTDLDIDGLLPGEPLTSEKALAFYQNPIAIAEGAAGAPSIETAALIASERMTTANVLDQTAGAAVGAVGTYALLHRTAIFSGTLNAGGTVAGSELRYSDASGSGSGPTGVAGTWRVMGEVTSGGSNEETSVFLRIS